MTPGSSKIVIIGGVAGLCAGVYAQACGYQVEILEQHTTPGGLATSWKRGDYIFETCIHWLVGSSPLGLLNAQWREVLDIDRLTFVYAEDYQRVESDEGQSLKKLFQHRSQGSRIPVRGPRGCGGDQGVHLRDPPCRRVASARLDEWPVAAPRLVRLRDNGGTPRIAPPSRATTALVKVLMARAGLERAMSYRNNLRALVSAKVLQAS
jgi:hypothetical protein